MARRDRRLQQALIRGPSHAARGLAAGVLAASALGCSLNPTLDLSSLTVFEQSVELVDVGFHPQRANHCGPASLLTILEHSAAVVDYESVVERVYVPGLKGSLRAEMQAATRSFGRIAYMLPPDPAAVLEEVAAGRPVLVLLNLRTPSAPVWHYAVVIGFDASRNRIVLRSGDQARSIDRASVWLRRWDWAGRWAMVALSPGEWPATATRDRLLPAIAAFETTAEPAASRLAWRTVVDRWPEEPIAWLGLGNAEDAIGNASLAIAAYRRALDVDPERTAARVNLALSLAGSDKPCDALEVLREEPFHVEGVFRDELEALEARLAIECPP